MLYLLTAMAMRLSDCVKKCKVCSDALDVAFEITKLIKFSLKRNAAFDLKRTQALELESFALLDGLYGEIL